MKEIIINYIIQEMGRKNRIEQPYGYKEQNGFVSEPINCSLSSQEIIEKINYILSNGFFGVNYDKELKSYSFTNANGASSDTAKLYDIIPNDLISNLGYNQETKKIFITFDNEETVELSLEDLVKDYNSLITNESLSRSEEDGKIWEAIGEMGLSGTNLVEMIQQEISNRVNEDTKLQEALEEEILNRKQGDDALSTSIENEVSARTSEDQSILEKITNEAETLSESIKSEENARTEEDIALWNALNLETSTRTEEDEKIWAAIGEMGLSGTNLVEMIQQETSNRVNEDTAIWAALNAEISSRIENDDTISSTITTVETNLSDSLNAEKKAREDNDLILDNKIADESNRRESGDTSLWNALSNEISDRENSDNSINEKLAQEILDRASHDGIIEGRIDIETNARETADNELSQRINDEKASRIQNDEALSNSIENEKNERTNEDTAIWEALSAETVVRETADSQILSLVNNSKVTIHKVETVLPVNVKEAYELKNALGDVLGARINIYKDSSLKDVSLVEEYDGKFGQFLKFEYILNDGSEKNEYIDVSKFLVEAEFKDGLVMNDAGEVYVTIDSASEPYLTVSQYGLKISGVSLIEQNLTLEGIQRQNGDTRLETLITTESTARQEAVNTLSSNINSEILSRESADTEIRNSVTKENLERNIAITDLSNRISAEVSARTDSDQELYETIKGVKSDLTSEGVNRTIGDTNLQNQIDGLKRSDTNLSNDIALLDSKIDSEISDRKTNDNNLKTLIDTKADSVNVYYKNEANLIFAMKTEIPSDFYSRNDTDEKINAVKTLINLEGETREKEDIKLANALVDENNARIEGDVNLQNEIDNLVTEVGKKVENVNANDASIIVDSTVLGNANLKVGISSEENQSLKLNADGLYARANLEYDEDNNVLNFINTTGSTSIQLKTKSQIDKIYYDSLSEEIVIEYTVNGSRKDDVRVPVHSLIQEWRVEDGNQGAISLEKEVSVGNQDVLKARLILNTSHEDNAATIDDNALYVSKNAILSDVEAKIQALENRVASLEAMLNSPSTTSALTVEETQNDSIDELLKYLDEK